MEAKCCTKCGIDKALSGFGLQTNSQKLSNVCKECRNEKLKRWRAKNPDKVKAANKLWRTQNPEKAKAAIKRWQEANPDKVYQYRRKQDGEYLIKKREYDKQWKAKNKDKVLEYNKDWAKRNPEKRLVAWSRQHYKKYVKDPNVVETLVVLASIKRQLKKGVSHGIK